jgi:hypothetical protein
MIKIKINKLRDLAQKAFEEKLNSTCKDGTVASGSLCCTEECLDRENKVKGEKITKEKSSSFSSEKKAVVSGLGEVTVSSKKQAVKEAYSQVEILKDNASDLQKISTISDVKNWLKSNSIKELQSFEKDVKVYEYQKDENGIKVKDAKGNPVKVVDEKTGHFKYHMEKKMVSESPAVRIGELVQNKAYMALPIFDRARIAAQMERGQRKSDYSGSFTISHKRNANMKMTEELKTPEGNFRIIGADTVQGCDQMCYECYAAKITAKTGIRHQNPIKAVLKGSLQANEILRIGTNGEPGKDWNHTALQVKDLIERSTKGDNVVTPEKNIFFISKMLNINGWNPDYIKNVEVSLDPLYPDHMRQSMINVARIKTQYPDTNFVLRIRSIASNDPSIMAVQQDAVDFANELALPVLETKLRFNKNISEKILDLDMTQYSRHLVEQSPEEVAAGEKPKKENQLKLNAPILKDKANNIRVCNEKNVGTGACAACHACYDLMSQPSTREANIAASNKAISKLTGLTNFKDNPELDVRGGEPGGLRGLKTKTNPAPIQIKVPKQKKSKTKKKS